MTELHPQGESLCYMSTALENPNYKGILTDSALDEGINMKLRIHSEGYEVINGDKAVNTAKDPSSYKLKLTLSDKMDKVDIWQYTYETLSCDKANNEMSINISAAELSTLQLQNDRDYRLLAELIDKESGERTDYNIHTIRKRKDFSDLMYYVNSEGILINNTGSEPKPEFFTYVYLGNNDDAMGLLEDGNYDAVLRYWNGIIGEDGKPKLATPQNAIKPYGDDFFAKATNAKLGVVANMGYYGDDPDGNYGFSKTVVEEDKVQALTAHWANNLSKEDNMLLYYMGDEQEPAMREHVSYRTDILNDIDLNRPTVFVDNRDNKNTIFAHNQSADIMALDVYQIKNGVWDNKEITKVNEYGNMGNRYTKPVIQNFINKPVWAIHQAADYGYIYNDGKTYGSPTEQQMLNIAIQSIAYGATGIGWYSYNDIIEGNDASQQLERLNKVNSFLEEYSDVIMCGRDIGNIVEVSPFGEEKSTHHIQYIAREYEGVTYVFMAQTGIFDSTGNGYTNDHVLSFLGYGSKEWHTDVGGVTVKINTAGADNIEVLKNLSDSEENQFPSIHASDSNSATIIMPTQSVYVFKIKNN